MKKIQIKDLVKGKIYLDTNFKSTSTKLEFVGAFDDEIEFKMNENDDSYVRESNGNVRFPINTEPFYED